MEQLTGSLGGARACHQAKEVREPWLILVLLILVGVFNYLDRILPGILAEPIRQDLNLSDTSLGIINGFAFLIVYATAGIPISRLADRGHHISVVTLSLAFWSGMTALGSLATVGWQFGVTRLGVALGEAGSLPAAQAFVSRNFSERRRGRALSLLALASPFGALCGLGLGGYAGAHLGWRMTFACIGIGGCIIAPLTYLAMRRHRPAAVLLAGVPTNARGSFLDLFRTRSSRLIVIGASLIAAGGYASAAFNPAFLMRVHHLSVAEVGVWLGVATGAAGIVGIATTGLLSEGLARRDPRGTLVVLAGTMLVAFPVQILAYLTANSSLAVACLAISSACLSSYVPLTVLALYKLVPADLRARTSATLLFVASILGGGGPLVVGLVSDALSSQMHERSIGYAMLIVPLCSLFAAAFYLRARCHYAGDISRTEAAHSHRG